MIPRMRRRRLSEHDLNGALGASYRHADFTISTKVPEDLDVELTHIIARAARLRDIESPAQLRRAERPLTGAWPDRDVLIRLLTGLSFMVITWAIHHPQALRASILGVVAVVSPVGYLCLMRDLRGNRALRNAVGTVLATFSPLTRQDRHKRDHDGGAATTPAD